MESCEILVSLNPDQTQVALRQIVNVRDALGLLRQKIKENTLDEEMRETLLSLAEHEVAAIGDTIGLELQSKQKIEERYAKIRAANMRIRDLERQLGRVGEVDILPRKLRLLTDKLRSWWRKEGFGYVSAIQYTEAGNCKVEFSCRLSGDFRLIGSETPVSDEERRADWLDTLRADGFDVIREGGYDANIVDNDNGRRLVMEMIQARFPSAQVVEFSNHFSSQANAFFLGAARVMIRDLSEIDILPEPGESR